MRSFSLTHQSTFITTATIVLASAAAAAVDMIILIGAEGTLGMELTAAVEDVVVATTVMAVTTANIGADLEDSFSAAALDLS